MLGNPVKSPTKFILLCYNEFVRIIKYFDRIHSKYVDVEVTDKVARFLLANDKYLRKLPKRYNYYTVSLDNNDHAIEFYERNGYHTRFIDMAKNL